MTEEKDKKYFVGEFKEDYALIIWLSSLYIFL